MEERRKNLPAEILASNAIDKAQRSSAPLEFHHFQWKDHQKEWALEQEYRRKQSLLKSPKN